MIVTVTLDAALDVSYRIGGPLVPGARHQATGAVERATGTGFNVSRILARLGHETVTTGFVGGVGGRRIRARLAETGGIGDALIGIADSSRRTVSLVHATDALQPGAWPPSALDAGRPGSWDAESRRHEERQGVQPSGGWDTGSWRAGMSADSGPLSLTVIDQYRPWVTEPEWRSLLGTYENLLDSAHAVALSTDSVSGWGCDPLVRAALRRGVPVLLDVTADVGRTLLAAPDIVLLDAALAGEQGRDAGYPLEPVPREVLIGRYAARLRQDGARVVVVPLGPGDVLGFTPEGIWRATAPVRPSANVSREAVAAGLLSGLVEGISWPERIGRALALSAVSIPPPAAGEFDPVAYQAFLPEVQLTRMAPVPGVSTR